MQRFLRRSDEGGNGTIKLEFSHILRCKVDPKFVHKFFLDMKQSSCRIFASIFAKSNQDYNILLS